MNTENPVPIWVLNLRRDEDRREKIEKHLHSLGVHFHFVDAVDGSLLTKKELKSYSKKAAITNYGRELKPGEIGCAFSHIKMWEMIVIK